MWNLAKDSLMANWHHLWPKGMWVSHQRAFAGCCVLSSCVASRSFKIWEATLDLLANLSIAAKKVIFLFISWKVSLRVAGHLCLQGAVTFPKPFSSLMYPSCAILLSSPQTDPMKEGVLGRCWCLNHRPWGVQDWMHLWQSHCRQVYLSSLAASWWYFFL